MSTGADAKTMPVTDAYATEHERIFGERRLPTERVERRVYVSRCSACDGVTFKPGELLFDCARCKGKDCYGLVDAATAPPLQEANEAKNAPVMAGRFYENTSIITADEKGKPLKVDIGTRMKHRDYLRRTGLATADDFKESWKPEVMARAKRADELRDDRDRHETVGRNLYEVEKRGRR